MASSSSIAEGPSESNVLSRSIDFCIPRITTIANYVDNSYTDVKLAPGLFESLHFEPWTEFDNLVERTKRRIELLPEVLLLGIEKELENIRCAIDPKRAHKDVNYENALRELYDSPSRIGNSVPDVDITADNPSIDRNSASGHVVIPPHSGSTASAPGHVQLDDKDSSSNNIGTADAGNSTSGAAKTPYTNSSSCTRINSKVLDLVEHLIRLLRRNPDCHLMSAPQVSSEIGKKYEIASSSREICNIVPDVALTDDPMQPCKELPLCSFELKGPLRKLWRVSKKVKSRNPSRPAKRRCPEQTPSTGLRGSRDVSNNDFPATNDKSEEVESSMHRREEDPVNYSAKGLADFYNDIFGDPSILTRTSDKGTYYFVCLPVAQALLQALLTETGCSALYTHQEAIAFQVFETQRNGKEVRDGDKKDSNSERNCSISVRVSRAFACDEEPGNICAMTALADYCFEESKKEGRKSEVRELFNKLTHRYTERKLTKQPGNKNTSTRQRNAEGSGIDATESARKSSSCSGKTHRNYELIDLTNCSTHGASRSSFDDAEFTREFAKIVETNHGVIGWGSSSVVVGGYFQGHRVAIKSWNGVDRHGLACLLNEIEIYKFLFARGEKVLGTGIPSLRMLRAFPVVDAVIVIDEVGGAIQQRKDGEFYLCSGTGTEQLGSRDVECLARAAVRSLQLLHDSGIIHGDISLRNLRVQRNGSMEMKGLWEVWWIDLGLSHKCSARLEMEIELEKCANLFPQSCIESVMSPE